MNKVKYLLVYTIPLVTVASFTYDGIWSWSTIFYAFIFLPLIDHILTVDSINLTSSELKKALQSSYYNLALYATVPVQIGFVIWFLVDVSSRELSTIDSFSSSDMHSQMRKQGRKYQVKTISLEDLLDKYDAPSVIDYLSIDTEGSEFEILSSFNFEKYKFKIITCEHNFTSNREKIYDLLTEKGISVIERHIMPEELEGFEQCWLTGTAAEVTPVGQIGDYTFEVGALTKEISDTYDKLVRS